MSNEWQDSSRGRGRGRGRGGGGGGGGGSGDRGRGGSPGGGYGGPGGRGRGGGGGGQGGSGGGARGGGGAWGQGPPRGQGQQQGQQQQQGSGGAPQGGGGGWGGRGGYGGDRGDRGGRGGGRGGSGGRGGGYGGGGRGRGGDITRGMGQMRVDDGGGEWDFMQKELKEPIPEHCKVDPKSPIQIQPAYRPDLWPDPQRDAKWRQDEAKFAKFQPSLYDRWDPAKNKAWDEEFVHWCLNPVKMDKKKAIELHNRIIESLRVGLDGSTWYLEGKWIEE